MRDWIAACLGASLPFAVSVRAVQDRLAARLEAMPGAQTGAAPGPGAGHAMPPLPASSAPLYADAEPCDAAGWVWRVRDRPVWITRALGAATLGPREAHGLAAALLAHVAVGSTR